MHGSSEESILIDRQSTPQPKMNASPLQRQSSTGGTKQVLNSSLSDWQCGTGVAVAPARPQCFVSRSAPRFCHTLSFHASFKKAM